jgi:hypothetical protein
MSPKALNHVLSVLASTPPLSFYLTLPFLAISFRVANLPYFFPPKRGRHP